MHIKTLSVSELNIYIKRIIDNDFILKNTKIKGEISNFKFHNSGHVYFSLKDKQSKINCVMFRSYTENLNFIPQNGDNVIIKGRVSVYQKDGLYQFYCEEIEKEGIGDLFIAFEKLKKKLYEEGLFDEEHKKRIPLYSKKIGVITSATGAAIKDIINVSKRRNKGIEILIYPSLVQGENASENLMEGIKYLDSRDDVDLIIIARGGGSIEELWAFNNEALAYEIYKCSTPIISGVGHETDFTICDFVSDMRAPTPSAAAELAVCSLEEINGNIENYKEKLYNLIKHIINLKLKQLNSCENAIKLNNPLNTIVNEYIKIDNIKNKLYHEIQSKIEYDKIKLSKVNSLLNAHNPLNILSKGFSIIQDEMNNIISNKDNIKKDDSIKITFKDGETKVKIKEVYKS
ncbi:exodeoxyribonuclease VII large subunit [Clostridium botulinum C]|uniref:Exodeoxyribonuclease 7 large subunit n=2 Tax=Clostridium botulinum TaxID=1491 RepID=A0A9Q4TDZ0_CLOBO|nr:MULTISPECIES: exodeoxyribonuclease VII large subunit [Clostridium]KEI10579.1 exodeoxyribonuclease VII large subunit [Clostridium sp. K25]MCD3194178.1 exodeoxyribonuclease VII large subunit [Clostridium botulinum C]MCD3199193.1 exodeoxyribonuclease VII large subunit [Clostridium botulinum C]MCD3204668.1 exodeoxyribonuclease VII large subunit [Clostridium botulinum C]MCD3208011.1 exodeoxyribonuclease VII large subunit [Clostridium botulinum C]